MLTKQYIMFLAEEEWGQMWKKSSSLFSTLKKHVQIQTHCFATTFDLHLCNILIWDSTQKVSPCWQAVDCGHHPLICNHKPPALVFHGLPLGHLYGGHVGSRVWRCLSATNYTLTWNDHRTETGWAVWVVCTQRISVKVHWPHRSNLTEIRSIDSLCEMRAKTKTAAATRTSFSDTMMSV